MSVLPECAAAAQSLSELQHPSDLAWWRRHVGQRGVYGAFAALAVFIACLSPYLKLSLPAFAILVGGTLVLGFVFGNFSRSARPQYRFPRRVILDKEYFRVITPASNECFALNETCWFVGRNLDDPAVNRGQAPQACVLIMSPDGTPIACGIAGDNLADWVSRLEQSTSPRVMRRSGARGCLFSALSICMFLAGAGAGGILAHILTSLGLLFGPMFHDIAVRMGAIFGGFGSFLACWLRLPHWYYPIEGERMKLVRFAVLMPIVFAAPSRTGLPFAIGIICGLIGSTVCFGVTWIATRRADVSVRIAEQRSSA